MKNYCLKEEDTSNFMKCSSSTSMKDRYQKTPKIVWFPDFE